MTAEPYAATAAALLDEGYRLESITEPEVVQRALDGWLRERVDAAIAHHAAASGNDHQAADRCESWYALHDCLQLMHDESRRFVMGLLKPKDPS